MAAVGRAGVTQLEFHQAMSDFKVMFPEMDEDVIEVVLRANKGAVDSTIDQLLNMSTDNENERLRTELEARENEERPPSYSSPATPPPSYHQAVLRKHHSPPLLRGLRTTSLPAPPSPLQKVAPPRAISIPEGHQSECPRRWDPPLLGPLPPDFLRLEPTKGKLVRLSSSLIRRRLAENEAELARKGGDERGVLEDERIALFLQNEEFVRELFSDTEFRSMLDIDAASTESHETQQQQPEDALFRERLKNMGKMSKRKFAQLASLFSRRKRAFKPILCENNPSRDNLLESSEEEEEEAKEEWKGSWNSHNGGERHRAEHS